MSTPGAGSIPCAPPDPGGVAGYDAVVLPTSPILPPNAERLMVDQDYYVADNLLALRNTRIANMMDLCALTLPTGQPSCGITLMMAAPRRGAAAAPRHGCGARAA